MKTGREHLDAGCPWSLAIGDQVDLYVALQEPGTPLVRPAEHRATVSAISETAIEFTLVDRAQDIVELPLPIVLEVCTKVPSAGASPLH